MKQTTKDAVKKNPMMLYTPNSHIPIGQAAKTPAGEYVLRVKKHSACEEVSLSTFVQMLVQTAESVPPAE